MSWGMNKYGAGQCHNRDQRFQPGANQVAFVVSNIATHAGWSDAYLTVSWMIVYTYDQAWIPVTPASEDELRARNEIILHAENEVHL